MRLIERLPADEAIKPLRPPKERQLALRSWLISEVEDAFSSLQPQHSLYTELLKVYEGVPDRRVRNIPFENAPNVVVTWNGSEDLGSLDGRPVYLRFRLRNGGLFSFAMEE